MENHISCNGIFSSTFAPILPSTFTTTVIGTPWSPIESIDYELKYNNQTINYLIASIVKILSTSLYRQFSVLPSTFCVILLLQIKLSFFNHQFKAFNPFDSDFFSANWWNLWSNCIAFNYQRWSTFLNHLIFYLVPKISKFIFFPCICCVWNGVRFCGRGEAMDFHIV